MITFSPLIQELMEALRCLPGVGPKSAQRMALTLLERDREGALSLSSVLHDAMVRVKRCQRCRMLSEHPMCGICEQESRDDSVLCIVESPADVIAIEQASAFRGLYFVLLGHLSPIDGIGPDDIGIPALKARLQDEKIEEVILATNPTVEGEATAFYISELAKSYNVKASRIAHGVPRGSELEYVDSTTLAQALVERDLL